MNLSTAAVSTKIKENLSTQAEVPLKLEGASSAASTLSGKIRQNANKVHKFFENHTTTRKFIAYVPNTLFRVALLTDAFTSFKVLPESRCFRVVSYILILGFCDSVRDFDSYLARKKIEQVN